ncbi:carboxypeptidase regulatory-like domain-containing protein [Candidatus Palauibacter sp.]|uniref:carboxypeptidase regulatory-like domain-containing protein n=1 Tax=Candidatus Palauibacter sp. TaxID=3101350 RepID=UPI003B5CE89B
MPGFPNLRSSTVTLALAALALVVGARPAAAQESEECGDRASLSVLVTDESGLMALPTATVVLRWTAAERVPVRDIAGVDGRFHLCVPEDARGATLWAEFGEESSEQSVVTFEPGETSEVVLRVLSGTVQTGRVIGQVVDGVTERPVVTAAVSVLGRTEVVETNRRGRFVLSGIPAGEHEIRVQRLGYAPLRHSVGVSRGLTTEMEIGLVPTPAEMEPIVATVTRLRRLEIKGFYERKLWGEAAGGGTFITADYIERWRPNSIGHLVANLVPSIRCLGDRQCILVNSRMSMGFSDRPCAMNVYLDGILVGTGRVDSYALPAEVGGIEVYKGPASLPAEFAGSDARCGAVVVWTK